MTPSPKSFIGAAWGSCAGRVALPLPTIIRSGPARWGCAGEREGDSPKLIVQRYGVAAEAVPGREHGRLVVAWQGTRSATVERPGCAACASHATRVWTKRELTSGGQWPVEDQGLDGRVAHLATTPLPRMPRAVATASG